MNWLSSVADIATLLMNHRLTIQVDGLKNPAGTLTITVGLSRSAVNEEPAPVPAQEAVSLTIETPEESAPAASFDQVADEVPAVATFEPEPKPIPAEIKVETVETVETARMTYPELMELTGLTDSGVRAFVKRNRWTVEYGPRNVANVSVPKSAVSAIRQMTPAEIRKPETAPAESGPIPLETSGRVKFPISTMLPELYAGISEADLKERTGWRGVNAAVNRLATSVGAKAEFLNGMVRLVSENNLIKAGDIPKGKPEPLPIAAEPAKYSDDQLWRMVTTDPNLTFSELQQKVNDRGLLARLVNIANARNHSLKRTPEGRFAIQPIFAPAPKPEPKAVEPAKPPRPFDSPESTTPVDSGGSRRYKSFEDARADLEKLAVDPSPPAMLNREIRKKLKVDSKHKSPRPTTVVVDLPDMTRRVERVSKIRSDLRRRERRAERWGR